jgi:hypothetical protein
VVWGTTLGDFLFSIARFKDVGGGSYVFPK